MKIDELKERLSAEWNKSLEQLEDNRFYVEGKDRYENLTPIQQKLVSFGLLAAVILFLASIPLSYYTASEESMVTFSDTRQLIRDLLKTSKESKEIPEVPIPPPLDSLKTQVDGALESAKLLPEQISESSIENSSGGLINAALTEGVLKVSLKSLNLRQIVDFGHEFTRFSPSVKMKDLQITASMQEPGYFDVVYKLLVLKVKPKVVEEPEKPKRKKS